MLFLIIHDIISYIPIFIANVIIHFNLFRFYWKYFNIIFSFFLYFLGENKFVYSNKLLPFNMKSIYLIQKYPHSIELYGCILFLFSMSFIISFGISLTPKWSRYVMFSVIKYNAIQWAPLDSYWSRFITHAPSFILGKLFLE